MPIVDYNRIYHVQSRERRPVLNPVNVPDAAGAFIRAGVPAAGAALPGLRARLDDANARYRERAGRDRDRFRAIGDLIGVGRDVALAYAGAVERRDQADLNALQAAWQDHMIQGAEDAWRRPYKRGGENGAKPDGPLVAIRELDAAFDESDAMNGARPAVKQRFAEWRRRASQSYYAKGQRLQSEAQDNFQQNALLAKWQASDAKIKTLYGLEDEALWEDEVKVAIEGRLADARFQMRRKGMEFSAEQENGLRENLEQQYEIDRAKYWCAVAASSDVPGGGDEELGMAAVSAGRIKDDAARIALEGRIEAARQSRERNVERADRAFDEQNDSIVYAITTETDRTKRDAALDELQANESGFRLDKNKIAHRDRVEKVKAFCDVSDFKKAYDEAMKQTQSQPGSVDATVKALDGLQTVAESMRTEAGREFAQRTILAGRQQLGAMQKAEIAAFIQVARSGFRPVRDEDGTFGREEVSIGQIVDGYHALAPYMDSEQASQVESAIRKRISDGGLDIPSNEEVMLAFEWVGWKKGERDELIGTFNGDHTVANRVFSEADNPLIRFTSKGWTVDAKRFAALDDPKASDRDGFISVRRSDGRKMQMDLETIQLVMDTLSEYKAATRLAKGNVTLDTLKQRLLERTEPIRNRSVVEAAEAAAEEYNRRWRVFQQPQALLPE